MRARLKHRELARRVARSRMSQNRWAQKLGLSRGHFSELVNGRRPYPSPRTRDKLLNGLGLEFEDLFEMELQETSTASSRRVRRPETPVMRSTPWPSRFLNIFQVRTVLRSLGRQRGFSAFVVAVLGLGIGLTTAVFSIISSVLLDPLPYREPGQLVAIFRSQPGRNLRNPSSPADFGDYRRELTTLQNLVAAHPWSPVWTRSDRSERVSGLKASRELFELLGVNPMAGTVFERSGDEPAVVLGYEFWKREFGADPSVIGRAMFLDTERYFISGVMPEGFYFPPFWATEAEFWVPLDWTPAEASRRNSLMLRIFGRLAPGGSAEEAAAELKALFSQLQAEYPDSYRNADVRLERILEPTVDGSRSALWFLGLSAGLVLLVACANVANLLLARTLARGREIATRQALGAGRGRLLTQFLTEGALLSVLAAVAGVVLAGGLLTAFEQIGLRSLPRAYEIGFNWSALIFSMGVTALTALLFGLTPALLLRRLNLESALRVGGRWDPGSIRPGVQHAMVIGQLALAVVLLFGAGLFLRSFQQLSAIDPGFKTDGILTYTLSLSGTDIVGTERQRILFEQIEQEVGALPEVQRVGVINHLPIGGDIWQRSFQPDRTDWDPEQQRPSASYRVVTAAYFETMEIPLLRGRLFDGSETGAEVGRVLVNETLATRFFPEGEAVGRRLLLDSNRVPVDIIGVVGDVRQWSLTDDVRPEIYYSYADNPVPFWRHGSLVVEPSLTSSSRLQETIRERIWSLNSGLAISSARPMDQILAGAVSRNRLQTILVTAFAATGLALSAVGVYAVLAYLVNRRRTELAVRMALGAAPSDIRWNVTRIGAALGTAGLLVGGLAALGTSRLAAGFLYGSADVDPTLLAIVLATLAVVLLAACWLPARRAARLDPLEALRE